MVGPTAEIVASYIVWDSNPVMLTADEAVRAQDGRDIAPSRREAEEFLRVELAAGPRSADEIEKAAKAAGVAMKTVKRAKASLKIRSYKSSLSGGWLWSLPGVPIEEGH